MPYFTCPTHTRWQEMGHKMVQQDSNPWQWEGGTWNAASSKMRSMYVLERKRNWLHLFFMDQAMIGWDVHSWFAGRQDINDRMMMGTKLNSTHSRYIAKTIQKTDISRSQMKAYDAENTLIVCCSRAWRPWMCCQGKCQLTRLMVLDNEGHWSLAN